MADDKEAVIRRASFPEGLVRAGGARKVEDLSSPLAGDELESDSLSDDELARNGSNKFLPVPRCSYDCARNGLMGDCGSACWGILVGEGEG